MPRPGRSGRCTCRPRSSCSPPPRSAHQAVAVPSGGGSLFVFGGASHSTTTAAAPPSEGVGARAGEEGQNAEGLLDGVAYGTLVVDHGDMHCLDLATGTWVKCSSFEEGAAGYRAAHQFRGGVNSLVVVERQVNDDADADGSPLLKEGIFISGGMHSELGAPMPDFIDERAEIVVSL